jgi:integrase
VIRVWIRKRGASWQMFWQDPLTRRRKTKTATAKGEREAIREAAKLEEQLAGDFSGRTVSWEEFRDRFDAEHLAQKAHRTAQSYTSALNVFEAEMGTPPLSSITADVISRYAAKLWASKRPASCHSQLSHLRSALHWAKHVGMISHVPSIRLPSVAKEPRGRPLTPSEVARMIWQARRTEVENDLSGLATFVRALRHSGLRIGEMCQVSWTQDPVRLSTDGRWPAIVWSSRGQKNRKQDRTVVTPELFRLASRTPTDARTGTVFPVLSSGRPIGRDRIGKIIAEVGRTAGIVTSRDGVFASAHDLRRTFATEMAKVLKPIELRAIMRHSNIQTTLSYYVESDSDTIGQSIWGDACAPICTPDAPDPANARRFRVFSGG